MDEFGSITRLIHGVRQGERTGDVELWRRYHARLLALARNKLRDVPRRAADEEDVVLGAFDSFLRSAEAGRFPNLNDRDDLWQVLVMLTARKAVNQRVHEQRAKRGGGDVRGESVFARPDDDGRPSLDRLAEEEPTPELAVQVSEQCRLLLDRLGDDTLRRVAIAKMEGYTNDEIAGELGVKTRTIERKLQLIRDIWGDAVQ